MAALLSHEGCWDILSWRWRWWWRLWWLWWRLCCQGPHQEHHNCQELMRNSALDDDVEEEDDLDDITTLMLSGPSPAASSLSKVNEQRCTFQICHSDIGRFAAQRWTRWSPRWWSWRWRLQLDNNVITMCLARRNSSFQWYLDPQE